MVSWFCINVCCKYPNKETETMYSNILLDIVKWVNGVLLYQCACI